MSYNVIELKGYQKNDKSCMDVHIVNSSYIKRAN